jgi:hypothetical protein
VEFLAARLLDKKKKIEIKCNMLSLLIDSDYQPFIFEQDYQPFISAHQTK